MQNHVATGELGMRQLPNKFMQVWKKLKGAEANSRAAKLRNVRIVSPRTTACVKMLYAEGHSSGSTDLEPVLRQRVVANASQAPGAAAVLFVYHIFFVNLLASFYQRHV